MTWKALYGTHVHVNILFFIFFISAIEILGRYNVNKSIKYLRDIKVLLHILYM